MMLIVVIPTKSWELRHEGIEDWGQYGSLNLRSLYRLATYIQTLLYMYHSTRPCTRLVLEITTIAQVSTATLGVVVVQLGVNKMPDDCSQQLPQHSIISLLDIQLFPCGNIAVLILSDCINASSAASNCDNSV